MQITPDGEVFYTESELVDFLYQNPNLDLTDFVLPDNKFNHAAKHFHLPWQMRSDVLIKHADYFHKKNQSIWHLPEEYKTLDIAKWCLNQCKNETELQRVGKELLLYQERNLIPMLQFLKYFVDTLRANKVVWGVGRGSSVASYVLYLIGVHRINSIYYDLDIEEFLK